MEPKTALAGRLAPTIKGLIQAFGNVAVQRPALAPILQLLYLRLFALVGRIDRLATRLRDGTLPKPRHRAPKSPTAPNPARPPALRLPSGRGWLFHIAQRVAQWAPNVEIYVNHSDVIALAAAAPQAGRLLRPLCRLLLVPIPEHIRLPPRPRKPRPLKPRAEPLPPLSSHTPAPAGTG